MVLFSATYNASMAESIDKAITNTTKESEGKRSICNSSGKSKAPELPDLSGHSGGRWIAGYSICERRILHLRCIIFPKRETVLENLIFSFF